MQADRTHALLPWYANGTLAPEEKDAFERHLESCPPCREELVEVAHMRTEIARHGGAFFGEHPEPEMLGALFGMGETPIDPAEGERIRRHLAVCSSCNEESRWLMGTETAGTAELEAGSLAARTVRPYAASASRWWAQPSVARLWPAAAAAALAVLTTVLIPGPWRGAGSAGPVARGFLEPVRRTGIPEVLVRPEHTAIVLDIVSELTPTEMPARIELL